MESGKLLLQRCLAAHGRLGADVHFGDALMEAGDFPLRARQGPRFSAQSRRKAQRCWRPGPKRRIIVSFLPSARSFGNADWLGFANVSLKLAGRTKNFSVHF